MFATMIRVIPNVISRPVSRQLLVASKHSPTILLGVGVAGFIGTTVAAATATLKLETVLDEATEKANMAKDAVDIKTLDYDAADYKKDMVVLKAQTAGRIVRLYAPTFVLGAISIGCLVGSNRILNSRSAALAAAYASLDQGFAKYRENVIRELGADKDRDFRYSTQIEAALEGEGKKTKTVEVKKASTDPADISIYSKSFDRRSQSWSPHPMYNETFLRSKQNYANNQLLSRGHLFLNEVYDALGLERTVPGQIAGWIVDGEGDGFVDFGIFDPRTGDMLDYVVNGDNEVLLDFNVDGSVFEQI